MRRAIRCPEIMGSREGAEEEEEEEERKVLYNPPIHLINPSHSYLVVTAS
jgi:hypothetical protein